jgi:hypothetical protein
MFVMPATLVVHRGGWEASKADLAAVPVPEPTESYHPVPYGRFIEEVELHIPRFGLTVQSSAFALAREGGQMFGVLTCVNGKPAADYALAIGVRNSYDRSLSVGLTLGSRLCAARHKRAYGEHGIMRS